MALIFFQGVCGLNFEEQVFDGLKFPVFDEEVVAELLELEKDSAVESQDFFEGEELVSFFEVEEAYQSPR